MQAVVLFTIVAVMSASYLTQLGAPAPLKFLPEIMSAVVAVYVALAGIRTRFQLVHESYWLIFGAVTAILICGIVANSVDSGPILSGLRYVLRPIPFFLLPAVYPFHERQLKQQLHLITAFALLQLPIAIYQRYDALMGGHLSGDFVSGTLHESGILTIFLVGAISLILAMFRSRRLSLVAFAILFLMYLVPTTINETKITVFLLPFVVIYTSLFAASPGARLRTFGFSIVVLVVAGVIFVPVYDYMNRQNVGSDREVTTLSDMFTVPDYFDKYLNQETKVGDNKKEVGRIDAFTVPLSVVSRDPIQFVFGVGLGNASISSLGAQFSGEYSATLGRYATGAPSAGALLLETGCAGFLCVLALHWMIFRDSIRVARNRDTLIGSLALGWPAVVILSLMCMFYVSTIIADGLFFMFWYISGVISAERMRLANVARQQAAPEPLTRSDRVR
jgi:hypothetical protein